MFRLTGNFNGTEYQCLLNDFSDAYKVMLKSRKNADYLKMIDGTGKTRAIYLKNLGISLTI